MEVKEEFKSLILNGDKSQLFSFLKQLKEAEKKGLRKEIKALGYLWEYHTRTVTNSGYTYEEPTEAKGTEKQRELMFFASLVCDDFQTFTKRWSQLHFVNKESLDLVLDWHVPVWFEKLVNYMLDEGWGRHRLDYEVLLGYQEKGLINLSEERIARVLSLWPLQENVKNIHKYDPLLLLKHEITLQEHIWHLFEYECSVSDLGRWVQVINLEKDQYVWNAVFKYHNERGTIDRPKLLKEALLASNRNFNKNVSGWFMGLFEQLKPTEDELVVLDQELISVLNSPHSKVVNTSLKFLKQLVKNKAYEHEALLDELSILLNSETKSVVSSVIMIFQTTAKLKPDLRPQLCLLVCQTFALTAADLQLKAAKFIEKWAEKEDAALVAEIETWQPSLLREAEALLNQNFGALANTIEEPVFETESITEEQELMPVRSFESFEDMVFFASQAFDSRSPEDFDLLLAACVQFQDELKSEAITKLNPAFQSAFKLLLRERDFAWGWLNDLLATFFVNLGNEIVKRFGKTDKASLQELIKEYLKKDRAQAYQFSWGSLNIKKLKNWNGANVSKAFIYHKRLCIMTYTKVLQGDHLPVLSTPTHEPHWVDPFMLIDRIKAYQQVNTRVDAFDLEIAISRCLTDREDVVEYAQQHLQGELAQLMGYLYQSGEAPAKLAYPKAWQAATLVRNSIYSLKDAYQLPGFKNDWDHYHDSYSWQIETRTSFVPMWDRASQAMKDKPYTFVDIVYKQGRTEPKTGFIEGLGNLLKGKSNSMPSQKPLHAANSFNVGWENASSDVGRLLALTPNNPDSLMLDQMKQGLNYKEVSSEMAAQAMLVLAEYLPQFPHAYSQVMNDFMALCLVCNKSTLRQMVGEAWVVAVERHQADQIQIGASIGKVTKDGYLPLKRFIDAAMPLFNLTPKHKQAMSKLCTAMVLQMNETPPRGVKNLLDLLLEVGLDKEQDLIKARDILMGWTSSKTLQAIINKLINEI